MPYLGASPDSEVASKDLNGLKLILDADADTHITADTDDTIDISIAGADDFQFTANTFTVNDGSTIANLVVSGDTAAGDNAAIGYTAGEGLILTGQGSTNDITIKNDADSTIAYVLTGTTNLLLAGHLLINTTSDSGMLVIKTSAGGSILVFEDNAADTTAATANIRMDNSAGTGLVMNLNRSASDGNLVTFQHASSTEGTISVSGTTVTYGTFTGGHDAQWGADQDPGSEPPVGTLVSTVDEPYERVIVESEETIEEEGKDPVTRMKRRRLGPSDTIESGETVVDLPKAQLTKVKISDTQADKRVYGVFGNTHVETGDLNIHALGTSMVRVVGAAAGGDLIQSSATAGVAEKQSDDIIRSSTVGKVARAVAGVGERLVPCTIYCG